MLLRTFQKILELLVVKPRTQGEKNGRRPDGAYFIPVKFKNVQNGLYNAMLLNGGGSIMPNQTYVPQKQLHDHDQSSTPEAD